MPYLNDMYHAQNSKRAEDEAVGQDNAGQAAQLGEREAGLRVPPAGAFSPSLLAHQLGQRVLGQQGAVDAVVRAVSLASAGATDSSRPLSNILLVGPTGVGKTELVRQLAATLRSGPDDLCRIDMNSLAQEHYAASLSGAPPGYAGSKENFSLFDRGKIEGNPYSPGIVLFDEVEKAHPTVIRALLQIMDNGTLRLASGNETISFRNCHVFMTSNLGSTHVARRRTGPRRAAARILERTWPKLARSPLGAAMAGQSDEQLFRESVKEFFDIEMLNRIDETIVFSDLDEETAHRIARQELGTLRVRFSRKSVEVDFHDDVVEHVVRNGFDPVFGARSVRRLIRSQIATAIADAVHTAKTASEPLPPLEVRMSGELVSVRARPF